MTWQSPGGWLATLAALGSAAGLYLVIEKLFKATLSAPSLEIVAVEDMHLDYHARNNDDPEPTPRLSVKMSVVVRNVGRTAKWVHVAPVFSLGNGSASARNDKFPRTLRQFETASFQVEIERQLEAELSEAPSGVFEFWATAHRGAAAGLQILPQMPKSWSLTARPHRTFQASRWDCFAARRRAKRFEKSKSGQPVNRAKSKRGYDLRSLDEAYRSRNFWLGPGRG